MAMANDFHLSDSHPSAISTTPPKFIHGTFKGEPAITIPHRIEESLAAKFQTTLIGKFSQGKPGMDSIRRFTALQNFKGNVLVGLIDRKHVLLRFEFTEDYVRLFSRSIWNVEGKSMRILKWTSNFRVDRESSIIPIWLSLPMLPIHLVNQEFIFSLVSSFCKPLRIDSATELLKRPSVARVQVEFDVLDMLPSRVWVQSENGTGYWQAVEIEEALPFYCTYCWHIGHNEQFCAIKHPELHPSAHKTDTSTHKEYRPKQQQFNAEMDVQAGNGLVVPIANATATMEMEMDIPNFEKEHVTTTKKITSCGEQKGSTELPLQHDEVAIEETYQLQARKSTEAKSSQMQEQNGELQASQTAPNTTIPVQPSIKLNAENAKDGLPQLRKAHASMGSPTAEHTTTETLTSTPTLTAAQEQSLNNPAIMKENAGPMIYKTQQGASSKEQTFKSSKAGSTKGKENADEEGMVTKSNSATHSSCKIIGTSEALATRNSFEMLSELDTTHSTQLSVDRIQAELQFLNLDGPNVRRTGYTSDKDSKVKPEPLTPFQRITRTRKKKKMFDL